MNSQRGQQPLQPGFILHYRPYRNTSALLDCFTQYGRITAVARGIKRPKQHPLQLFTKALFQFVGQHDLKALSHFELTAPMPFFSGRALNIGLACNELLVRLLPNDDPQSQLLQDYQRLLTDDLPYPERIMRGYCQFQLKLLHALGYGIDLTKTQSHLDIDATQCYTFYPAQGLTPEEHPSAEQAHLHFSGAWILALQADELVTATDLARAQQLLQAAIGPLLKRPLKSAELIT